MGTLNAAATDGHGRRPCEICYLQLTKAACHARLRSSQPLICIEPHSHDGAVVYMALTDLRGEAERVSGGDATKHHARQAHQRWNAYAETAA
jgi:hypothetical protein